jgi:hypothetical protein
MKSLLLLPLVCAAAALPATSAGDPHATYAKDVAPILFRRCVECHRAGEAAPMPLVTYKEVRPWAKAIREKVLERSMPPWLGSYIFIYSTVFAGFRPGSVFDAIRPHGDSHGGLQWILSWTLYSSPGHVSSGHK